MTSLTAITASLLPGGDLVRGHCIMYRPAQVAYGTRPPRCKLCYMHIRLSADRYYAGIMYAYYFMYCYIYSAV